MDKVIRSIYHFKAYDFDKDEIVNIKVCNLIAMLALIISTMYSMFYYVYFDSIVGAIINQLFTLLYLLYFYFLINHELLKAKLINIYIFLTQLFFFITFLVGYKSGFQYYFLLVGPISFFLFNYKDTFYKFFFPLLSICLIIIIYIIGDRFVSLTFTEKQLQLLNGSSLIMVFVLLLYFLSIFQYEMAKKEEDLKDLANTDSLTGLLNRRAFYNIVEKIIKPNKKQDFQKGILLFDIDFFKSINDTYGHHIGDIVLKKVSSEINKHIYYDDCFARFGGEEFVIFLNDTNKKKMLSYAEDIRLLVESLYVECDNNSKVEFTISIGCSLYKEGQDIDEFIKVADTSMYEAKNTGRNKVIF